MFSSRSRSRCNEMRCCGRCQRAACGARQAAGTALQTFLFQFCSACLRDLGVAPARFVSSFVCFVRCFVRSFFFACIAALRFVVASLHFSLVSFAAFSACCFGFAPLL
ncbi:hypothetical protein TRVL_01294 [Trypanosoma vivax]|nr:hypothetical protein TRVL_01294 [Trypanosoma vivax]